MSILRNKKKRKKGKRRKGKQKKSKRKEKKGRKAFVISTSHLVLRWGDDME